MKKFISILLFALVLSLVGCQSPPDDSLKDDLALLTLQVEQDLQALQDNIDLLELANEDYEQELLDLQTELDTYIDSFINLSLRVGLNEADIVLLKEQVNGLQGDFESLTYIDGLNGQRSYYTVSSGMSNMSNVFLASELDKNKLPSYLFDIDGNAVNFDYLANKLFMKYFGVEPLSWDMNVVGAKTNLEVTVNDLYTKEEIAVRVVLMLEELANYDYWLIGASEIYVSVYGNNEYHTFSIYMPSFRSEGFDIGLDDYHYNDWEISTNFDFDLEIAQALYDQFILDETFIDYVLEFSK